MSMNALSDRRADRRGGAFCAVLDRAVLDRAVLLRCCRSAAHVLPHCGITQCRTYLQPGRAQRIASSSRP
ncbi:hypothetical protein BN2475_480066 [Paraburkholderia ribeironis]|uniref:Uncharacterized protein n=1 Tax=Paraburkholderia ribeironis TaxID=1247936 RepID=A0A1N7SB98_9BURK|nr:hypothetical protein BN2475_480066 [Paraburkholderia ribeironis]